MACAAPTAEPGAGSPASGFRLMVYLGEDGVPRHGLTIDSKSTSLAKYAFGQRCWSFPLPRPHFILRFAVSFAPTRHSIQAAWRAFQYVIAPKDGVDKIYRCFHTSTVSAFCAEAGTLSFTAALLQGKQLSFPL